MTQNSKLDHISVCICTFNRPEMLAEALNGVTSQVTYSEFSYEVVVVDNDHQRSAEDTVRQFQTSRTPKIIYECEPEQNIAIARNMAIRNTSGDLVAFIDDDECPVKDWLAKLYFTMKEYNADGALGPVMPFYPPGAPKWLKRGNVFNRRRFHTGTRLTIRHTRTGNVLLSRDILSERGTCFNPAFGRTGGEDVEFFGRQISSGRVFVWCDEAVVYETVSPERWRSSFHFKKYFRIGTLNGERLRGSGVAGLTGILKSISAVPGWIIVLLFSLPLGKHVWMGPVLKLTYSVSCLLAYCGLSLLRYRD